jgi:alpha-tubulin suppressor-like RCC1 family protein
MSNVHSFSTSSTDDFEIAKRLLTGILYMKDACGRSFLHTQFQLSWAKALLDRAKSLDDCQEQQRLHHYQQRQHPKDGNSNCNTHSNTSLPSNNARCSLLQRRFLLQPDSESGYTPLHRAIVDGNLAAVLLLLRHAMDTAATDRLTQRPMTVLHAAEATAGSLATTTTTTSAIYNQSSGGNGPHSSWANNSGNSLLLVMATATDHEGFTPLQLMGQLQRVELARCRRALEKHFPIVDTKATRRLRPRQSSFGAEDDDNDDDQIDFFSENGDLFQPEADSPAHEDRCAAAPACEYACEVVTYGRPHHCALGFVQGGGGGGSYLASSTATVPGTHHHSSTFCPQRVQAFAQETVQRDGAAVAVAAATHHTLVVTQNGHVYVCGLEKGGRLGLGDDQPQQCPLPRRILGALQRRRVVAVAAAENHSLCVTREGHVYAWGSNRFGQLGDATAAGGGSSTGNKSSREISSATGGRSLPRRVEDLKHHPCVAVAAGERHSVALTSKGEVYVWGDNNAGQLGVPRRSGIQKVQRVEALWGQSSQPKIATAIAASDQSTLVLTGPTPGLTHVNSIYEWGHGNHVPMRVHFDNSRLDGDAGGGRRDGFSKSNSRTKSPASLSSLASHSGRVANPVAIACGRYHNAAITTDGRVYSWGLHAESLGRINNCKSQKGQEQQQPRRNSLPELVTGMLPEKGGGFAVAIAASDQHTAVVCDNGALFTWGTTDGKDLLGHEGVRWQPNPKRVPGVHRAVNVAVAKEHTVLLIGTSFPTIARSDGLSSLEIVAARKAAEHVDLFNVIPVLIMAERTEVCFRRTLCRQFPFL